MQSKKQIWINYVSDNLDIIEHSVKVAKINSSTIRECMAELGTELTPQELIEFTQVLEETIEYIKSKNKEK